VQFRVLGPVEIHTDDGRLLTLPRRQERCLLGILLLDAGQTVRMDRLCELLWDGNPPDHARQTVRTYVARVRALLAQAPAADHGIALLARHGGYLLKVAPELVDAHRFRSLLDGAAHTTDLAERDQLLRAALKLWHGPALDKAASDQVRQRLCADLDELRLHATEEALTTGLELGRHRHLLPQLARLAAERPVRERLVELHMLALYRNGRTAEALDVYHHARTRLADELGLDPSPALQQLHQAILRGNPLPQRQPDPTGQAARTGVRPAQLPADLPTFTGRLKYLRQLDKLLSGPTTTVVISAIAGTAGVGKTALAVHWAHLVRQQFPDGQLYANLHGFDPVAPPMSPRQVVRRFLDALQVPAQRIPADSDAQLDLYRSLLADRRMLIVLDNARDADQVRPLVPGTSNCLVLVTSRNRLTGLIAINGAQPLSLDLLTSDEARQLLATRLGTDRISADPHTVDDLINLCAQLPLALAIAAARIATESEVPLTTFAARLRTARGALDTLSADDTASNVRAVFACSYDALNPTAAALFRLLGLNPGPVISTTAAASLASIRPAQVQPLLAELTRANLLAETTPGRYTTHDLLRAYATEQTHLHDRDDDRRAALHRLLDHYLHTAHTANRLLNPQPDQFPLASAQPGTTPEVLTDPAQALTWFTTEQHTLLAAGRQAAASGFDTHTWQLAWNLVRLFNLPGYQRDWATTRTAALDTTRRLAHQTDRTIAHRYLTHTPADPDTAFARLWNTLRRFADADDHAGQAATHMDIACAFERHGRYADALDHAQQAIHLYRTAGNRDGQVRTLNAAGWYHMLLGNHSQAFACCEQAITLHQAEVNNPPR
jgi:DNA-binding SARP family transcriptional activator